MTFAVLPLEPLTAQVNVAPFLTATSFGQVTEAMVSPLLALFCSPALIERSALLVSICFAQPTASRAGTTSRTASDGRMGAGTLSAWPATVRV